MFLKDNNYRETIHAFSRADWKPILDLIPKIEKCENDQDIIEILKLYNEKTDSNNGS